MNRLKQYGGYHWNGEFQAAVNDVLTEIHKRELKDCRAIWFMWGFIAAGVFSVLVSVIRG